MVCTSRVFGHGANGMGYSEGLATLLRQQSTRVSANPAFEHRRCRQVVRDSQTHAIATRFPLTCSSVLRELDAQQMWIEEIDEI